MPPDGRRPRWFTFDEAWYRLRYPEITSWMEELNYTDIQLFYREVGCAYGHSPNRYFDEKWYCETYLDVRKGVLSQTWKSGFEHYCKEGYRTYSPHWLFDEVAYRRRLPSLTDRVLSKSGFWNGYDHYLEEGETHGLQASAFFDLYACREIRSRFPECFQEDGLFASWLVLPSTIADAAPVSWYFDPIWYVQTYPDVQHMIEEGRYANALHHYLTNDTPRNYDPNPFFSEEKYVAGSPDIIPTLEAGMFRNAYEHFVRFGAHEGRSPEEGVDLAHYGKNPLVKAQCESGLYDSVFARYVAERRGYARSTGAQAAEIEEGSSRLLFQREAAMLLSSIARNPLDFSVSGMPELSVIMVVHDQITLTLQAVASLRANYLGNIQLIIVDSGSTDETSRIETFIHGADILRYSRNIGYLAGCNEALRHVEAPAALYLNNDLRLYPNALACALKRLYQCETTGAVVAKLIRSNMRLQEAGSVIWRDGATYGYRREDDPNLPEANFVREVDYGSAAFLLIRTGLLRRLGGYDERYKPAYFEDTDLCVRLGKLGVRIIYDPCVVVEHLEFGSSGHAGSHNLIQRHWKLFAQAHKEFLRYQQPPHVRNALLGRERQQPDCKRVLFIEDRLPLRGLGSGYVRSNDIIRSMAEMGYRVTVYPVMRAREESFLLYREFPEDVELALDQDMSTLAGFLEERAGYYDLIWIGRTHNMTRLLPILSEASRFLFRCAAVLDTEVVAAPRTLLRRRILGEDVSSKVENLDDLLKEELQSAHYCQQIVAVTEHDASLIRRAGYSNVSVLGHAMHPMPTSRPYRDRKDILFLGAMHSEISPNYDSMMWFVRDVLPHLDDLPEDVVLRIAGYCDPSVDLTPLARYPRVELLGAVEDLEPLFDQCRVFVAPTRFAGGLPFKLHEAAAYGLPIVATTLLQEQVGWREGEALLSAPSDDPGAFARAVRRLYDNEDLWQHVRYEALEAVKRDVDPAAFKARLAEIMAASLVS
ncbi:glycosyltransferase [Saccharibacter sp. 17.LH.SD]|nr:glycosyltransferase [Saccharibacter sp. 17.LH.SD]